MVLWILNSITRYLKFTAESQEYVKDPHIPTLYIKVCMKPKNNQVTYTFFEKSVNMKYTVVEYSGISWEDKKSTLGQEVAWKRQRHKRKVNDPLHL